MYTKLIKIFLLSCLLALCQPKGTILLTDAADSAVTPYPLATELKPEQPFEEGTKVASTPDAVYGPPDVTDDANDSNVAISLAFDADVPLVGNADQDTDIIEADSLNPETTIDSDAEEALASDIDMDVDVNVNMDVDVDEDTDDTFRVRPEAERLIFRRRLLARPAKLRAAIQQKLQQQQQPLQTPSQGFFYIAQLQQF